MRAKEGHRYYSERTRLEEVIPLDTPFILYVDPSSGVASISSLSVEKLSQQDGTVLVLDGGDADAIASV